MRFELIGHTEATLTDIDIQSKKNGQTELKPAVALSFKAKMSNISLNMLGKTLRPFFFEKSNPAKEVQGQLAGVDPVSDLSALTEAAKWLGAQDWDEEQTGCKLIIYLGVSKIELKDATLHKLKFECQEGGGVEWKFTLYSDTDVDGDLYRDVGVLKNHDLDIELTGPELVSAKQKRIDEGGGKVTPISKTGGKGGRGRLGTDADQAERQSAELQKDPSQREDWPFGEGKKGPQTPEDALAGSAALPS